MIKLNLTLLFLIVSYGLNACACGEIMTHKQAYKYYDVVLSATVLEILSPIETIDTIYPDGKMIIRSPVFGYPKRLLIHTFFKGDSHSDTINIAGVDNNCELYLKVGETYIIYGQIKGGQIYTSKCSRSGLLDNHPDIGFLEHKIKRRKK